MPAGAMICATTLLAMPRNSSDCKEEIELRNPSPTTSSGRLSAMEGSTPYRSRRVLAYSVLVSRRMTNGPGSRGARYLSLPIHSTNCRRSASDGFFEESSGGMSCTFTLAAAFLKCSMPDSPLGFLSADCKLIPALARLPWQPAQYFLMNGPTFSLKTFCASASRAASSGLSAQAGCHPVRNNMTSKMNEPRFIKREQNQLNDLRARALDVDVNAPRSGRLFCLPAGQSRRRHRENGVGQ